MRKKYKVTGMTCAACQAHVDKACKSANGVLGCNVNLLKNTVELDVDDTFKEEELKDLVDKAGYGLVLNQKEKTKDASLIELIVSFIFLLLLMYFSMGVMMWNAPTFKVFDMRYSKMGFALIQFILVLPIVILQRKYFIVGFKRLFKSPSMDTLIALGASASLLYSICLLFCIAYTPSDPKGYHMNLYFEACGMILCFVSLGKYLEGLSKKKTTKALEKLFEMAPKEAIVLVDNQEVKKKIEDVVVGDKVVVKSGMQVPVDGEIMSGNGTFLESTITGESIPPFKQIGDYVYASTMVETGYVVIKAKEVLENTQFSKIVKLVDEASSSKAPISRLADKISLVFVPVVLGISILVFLSHLLYGLIVKPEYMTNVFEVSMNYAITVLVIACPCALGLATPVAIMVGTGKGASLGILVKNAEILEQTSHITTVVLDKTGTITMGNPKVTDCTIPLDMMPYFYSLEKHSNHPLALAIVSYGKSIGILPRTVESFKDEPSVGIEGRIDGIIYKLGSKKIGATLEEYSNLEQEGKTVLYGYKNDTFVGIIALRDEIKPDSKTLIEKLNKESIPTILLTGDNQTTANAIAKELGIREVIAEVKPEDKANVILDLKKKGLVVAMVGDGVNDAPALAYSDLGIAMGHGSDVALESSDIVLTSSNPLDIVDAIRLSKTVLKKIKLGLFWAFFYNVICIFLASGVLYHITKGSFQMKVEYGSILMSISSVSVVLNALSINLFKTNKKVIIEEKKEEKKNMQTIVIGVSGMMCKHCKKHVEDACKNVLGVVDAVASLEENTVSVSAALEVTRESLVAAITDAGYECK